MINENEPAFAATSSSASGVRYVQVGLTKREYFAAMAMQGLISGAETMVDVSELAKQSVAAADALIKELNKQS